MNLLNLDVGFGNYVLFIKSKQLRVPKYLFGFIPETNHIYNTRSSDNVTTFYSRTDVYKYSFFAYTILEWNKLNKNVQQLCGSFRRALQYSYLTKSSLTRGNVL